MDRQANCGIFKQQNTTGHKKEQNTITLNKIWELQNPYEGEAEAPVLWPSDAKSWFIRKDSDAGKD